MLPLTAEKAAQYEAYDRLVDRLQLLANGSLVFGFVGLLLFFRRRGCLVLVVAAGIILLCQLALLDATWVDF